MRTKSTQSTETNLIRRLFGTRASTTPVEAPRNRPLPAQHMPRWDEGIPPKDRPATKPHAEPAISLGDEQA